MITLQHLHRKTFKMELEVWGRFFGKETVTVTFRQGTMREVLRMAHFAQSDDAETWVREFLFAHGVEEYQLRKMVAESYNKILTFLLRTFAKGFTDKPKKGKGRGKKHPIYAGITTILQDTSIDLEGFLGMTWEQVRFVLRGLQYNTNELTKKGQNLNKVEVAMEEFEEELPDDEALAFIKKNDHIFS